MAFKKGEVCRLDGEPVIDIKSLLAALSAPVKPFIYLGQPAPARLTIFTAGIGNEAFAAIGQTQRRPLRMFMVRHNPFGTPVYVHWTGKEGKPGMTVTTHGDVLYLGGNVAEKAVGMDEQTALRWAKSEIQYRFPNFNWDDRQWAYHDVIRAEAAADDKLPTGPRVTMADFGLVAWPTKLAMTPLLADAVCSFVTMDFRSDFPHEKQYSFKLPRPEIARYPWETARWH
jgi:hypothetical protein